MTHTYEYSYQYQCAGCRHRFEVVMEFDQLEPLRQQAVTEQDTTGYPEQQPECPFCHSHEMTRVEIHQADTTSLGSPNVYEPFTQPHHALLTQGMPAMSTIELPTTNTPHTPTVQTAVGDLVTQRPARSRVFEKLGIDYCCSGKLSLEEACAQKNLDAQTILTTLLAAESEASTDEPTDGAKWAQTSLAELADHIEQTHHAYLKRELPRLEPMVKKVAAVHGEAHPWMGEIEDIYTGFAAEMQAHLMKEENKLFPMIRALENGESPPETDCGSGMDKPVAVMEHEHDNAGQALAQMRELSNNFTPPEGACNTFRATLDGLREIEADTHRHVHKENSILFPKALEQQESRDKVND